MDSVRRSLLAKTIDKDGVVDGDERTHRQAPGLSQAYHSVYHHLSGRLQLTSVLTS